MLREVEMSGLFAKTIRCSLGVAVLAAAAFFGAGADPADAHGWRRGYYHDHYYDRPVIVRPRYYHPPPVYYAPPPPPVYYAPPPAYYAPPPAYYGRPSVSFGLSVPIR